MINKNKIIRYCDQVIYVCLCLLIFCLPFAKAGAETFTWMAIFLWLFKRVLGYRTGALWGMLPKTELNKALGIFIAVNVLSVIFSSHLGLSLRGFFGKEFKFLAIYFMLVEAINNRERLKYVLMTIIASAGLIIFDASAQLFRGVDFLKGYKIDYYTFGASFFSSSGFAAWLIIIIPLFVGIIGSKIILNAKLKILLVATIIIQSLFLLRTYSRGAWLGFGISAVIMFYCFIRKSNFKIKLLYLFVAICLLAGHLFLPRSIIFNVKDAIRVKFKFGYTINERMMTIPQTITGSNFERIKWWKEALRIFRDYPLTGCGLNTYSVVARNYKSFEGGGIYPHNSYLQKAAETGLLGLFALLWVLFIFFKTELGYFNKRRDLLVLGLLSGIFAFLIHAFFDTHLYSLQLVVLFWYMLGLTVATIKVTN